MRLPYSVRKRRNAILSMALGLLTMFAYQNCSDLDNTDIIGLTDIERNVLQNLPFAYDAKVDQIAYMSCSGAKTQVDGRAFTIKAGGFFPGSGVGLRQNFSEQISHLNPDAKVRSLAVSERNDQAGVVMAIRPRSDLQNYVAIRDDQGGSPYAKLMFNELRGLMLSNERVARQLMALGPNSYLNYAAGLPGLDASKSFDGALKISANYGVEQEIRNYLRNSHYLTFGFAEPLGEQPEERPYAFIRSPYDTLSGDSRARTSVFGKGYVLNFQQIEPLMTAAPSRAMSITDSINLENSLPETETWDCSERFIIVRPEDAGRLTFNATAANNGQQVCDTRSDTIPTNTQEAARWERIRNILPVEDWYVNLPCPATGPTPAGCIAGVPKPGCIVPKGNSDFCYDMNELNNSNNEYVKVAYYTNEYLSQAAPPVAIDYTGNCGAGTMFICPHVVTLCYKR